MDKIIEANINNNVSELEVAEKLLLTLYEAWGDVVNNPRPDGVPSEKLQPELYAMYLNSKNLNSQDESLKSLKNNKTTNAAAVNLSTDVKPNSPNANVISKKVG